MNRQEILRYMRTSSKTDDERVLDLVDKAIQQIETQSAPKTIYKIFDCAVREDVVEIAGHIFESVRLAENLKGCKRVVVFGATLGVGCDRLIHSASACDVALALALQATAAAKIEEVCDNLEKEICTAHNVSLRQRYSPGYYDLDITRQKEVFALVDITKRIGLTLTDTCEMVPTKSVTAFIGIDEIE